MPLKTKPLPTLELLNEALRLDVETGLLFWKERPRHHFTTVGYQLAFNRHRAGHQAGRINQKGYWCVRLSFCGKGEFHSAHRIVWKLVHGTDPVDQIDHIDRDRTNNRPSNLREADHSLNMQNRRRGPGISKSGNKFRARIKLDGSYVHLGNFDTKAEAEAAITTREAARAANSLSRLIFGDAR